MASLKILNVGQGDSFLLSPHYTCRYHDCDIFIDLGDGHHDIFMQSGKEKIIILFSHSHTDHIGGMSFGFHKCFQRIHEIWLPYYYDEICIITDFVLRLKGVNRLPGDNGAVIKAKNILSTSKLLQYLKAELMKPVLGLYEGSKPCTHMQIYNPPVDYEKVLDIDIHELKEYVEELRRSNYAELRTWFDEENFSNILNSVLTEGWSENVPQLIDDDNLSFDRRHNFILGMVYKLRDEINKFVERSNAYNFARVFRKIKLSSNDASVVLKYSDSMLGKILFTGDVGIKPLERLISHKADLEAQTLKVPHHGSRHNLNRRVLRYVNPSLAIISHDNGRFGRQSDPHPNKSIIKLLESDNIQTVYTNNVIKKGQIVKAKPNKSKIKAFMEYVDHI